MNCHECKNRRSIPGDCHSACSPPGKSPFDVLMQSLVKMNAHGVRNGWCNCPLNFDPMWIEECLLFSPKETEGTGGV